MLQVLRHLRPLGQPHSQRECARGLVGEPRCGGLFLAAERARAGGVVATRPAMFGPQQQAAATRFADEASRALTLAVRWAERAEMSQNLQHALASRAVIDQALGIIMGQNRCSAEEAFDILRTTSQNRNVKLRDIAAAMVAAVSGHPPPFDARFS